MKQDKLLAKMETAEINFRNIIKQYDALIAVVELHKPTGIRFYESYCLQCMKNNGDGIIVNVSYPCPTIQAIEAVFNA